MSKYDKDRKKLLERARKTKSGCWEYSMSCAKMGYGSYWFSAEQRLLHAHRVSWIVFRGPIPKGKFVLHKCDNKPCFNPKHLYIGTQADNVRDTWERNPVYPFEKHPEKRDAWMASRPRGRKAALARPNIKIGVAKAKKIYAATGRNCEIAKKFGVTWWDVYGIKTRRTWAHIHEEN